MKYTEQREKALHEFGKLDAVDDDYSNVLEMFNTEFRSFGDGLKDFLALRPIEGITDPISHLKALCVQSGTNISNIADPRTLKSWFNDSKRPRKSDDSRRKIFAFAFALKLTPDETKELFHKVYLDRAFNKRNYKEVIYYYCLKHEMSFEYAEKLIERVFLSEPSTLDRTMYTSVLSSEVENLEDERDLISYIQTHSHNFSMSTTSAKRVLLRQREEALKYAQEEAKCGYDSGVYSHLDRKSNSFLYFLITDQRVNGDGARGTSPISFKDTTIPTEIKTNFPQHNSLSGKIDSFEELRKSIILLFSYHFWRKAAKEKISDFYVEYCDELNSILVDAGLPQLYPGNPYDWMFLFCTEKAYPLDTFRGLLAEILDIEY